MALWKINDEGDNYRERVYYYEIDVTIAKRVGKIMMFTANDEDPMGKDSLKTFHDALGGTVIDLENHGHYTLNDMGTEVFPEPVEQIV